MTDRPLPGSTGGSERDPDDERLDSPAPELAEMPAADVIGRAAAMLVGAAAEHLGLADDGGPSMSSPHALEEARRLVAALDGLLATSVHHLDAHAAPLSDSVAALHDALRFRQGAAHPGQPEDRDPTDRGIS